MRDKLLAVVIIIFLLWSMAPTWYELAHRNRLGEIRSFELVHNFPTDYNFYLSRIREGLEGRLTVIERYTSEPHNGSFIHVFYLVLGWIGRFVRVPLERVDIVYHVARVVFGGLLLALVAEYCKKAFEKLEMGSGKLDRDVRSGTSLSVIAFLLAITASTWPKLVAFNNNQTVPVTLFSIASWRFSRYMPWWSVMDSLQRMTFIPHLLVGQALIVFLLLALSDDKTMSKGSNWLFLGMLAFVLGIVFPPGLLFMSVTLVIMVVLHSAIPSVRNVSDIIAYAGARGLVIAMGLPALLYLQLMTSFYPWKRLAEFDIIHPLPFDYKEYFLAVGPMLLFGLLGLIVSYVRKERRMMVSVAWVLAWLLLLAGFHFVPQQSPLRVREMLPHVPLGVLTAYLFYAVSRSGMTFLTDARRGNSRSLGHSRASLSGGLPVEFLQRFKRTLGQSSSAVQNANPRGSESKFAHVLFVICHLSFVIPISFIAIGLGVMYSSWLWQRDFIDHKMTATYPLVPTGSYVMYPLKDFMEAIRFLQKSVDKKTIILSETTAGNYIPVWSGNTGYV